MSTLYNDYFTAIVNIRLQPYRVIHCSCCWNVFSPLFTENTTIRPLTGWPAPGGVTEQQAVTACEERIYNHSYIGNSCFSGLRNSISTRNIVQGCIDDVLVCLSL